MCAANVEGFAYLCFFDDGSWFQGILLTEDKKQYGMMGETVHYDYIVKKANRRLYALRQLKKYKVPSADIVHIYCTPIRSILEYASTVFAGSPKYLACYLENVQKRALFIIWPGISYETALDKAALFTLSDCQTVPCIKFIACDPPEEGFAECCFEDEPLFYKITVIDHEANDDKVFKHVMKTGGDNCTLTSSELDFETEELLVGAKAERHVMKYCQQELRGRESVVCSGRMSLHQSDETDE